jgi:hypothetical protein
MPAFLITYTSPRQSRHVLHETHWITPSDFDRDRARASFEAQCPSAAVVSVEPVEPC